LGSRSRRIPMEIPVGRVVGCAVPHNATEEVDNVPVGDAMTVRIVSVAPSTTVHEAITRMLEEGIGAVAVCDGPRLVGIFTERDVLRVAGEGPMFNEIAVENVMTRRPVTCAPEDDLTDAAQLMADKRIRHLPVCQG